MTDKTKIHRLLIIGGLLLMCSVQLYSQRSKQVSFTLGEYSIKDSNFYNELCTILFSDTIFGRMAPWRFLAMRYDTNFIHTDYEKGGTFSANFNIFDLMDGGDILHTTKSGKGVIGYFCIKGMPCFILNSTQQGFVLQYLIQTDKKRRFTFRDLRSEGGYTSVYMNILPNKKIEVVRVFSCD